jgi:hypothetical protein
MTKYTYHTLAPPFLKEAFCASGRAGRFKVRFKVGSYALF